LIKINVFNYLILQGRKPIIKLNLKILFILEYYYPNVGGIEKLFKELAEALVKKNYEVMVITNRYEKTLESEERINGVRVKRVHLKNRFFFSFFSLPTVLKHARNFDLIHTTSYNAALPASLAGAFLNKKVIITFHEVWGNLWFKLPFMNRFQKSLFYLYEKLILKLPFNTFIAVSDSTKQNLISHSITSQKIIRIYNGIEYKSRDKDEANASKKFTFTFLGRLGVSKGLDMLIPAAGQFIKEYPEAIFQIISPDNSKTIQQKVENLIRKHHLEKNVNWFTNLDSLQVEEKLLSSNCMVIPSYSEGFCFVAAEAIALEIPIISSGKGALQEVVSGKFIKMETFDSKGIYQSLVKAKNEAYEITPIKKFHFQDTLEAYLKLYQSICISK
jgi:glycosyltransferase involved in cell wall biosynthesis